MIKRKIYPQDYSTQQGSHSDLMKKTKTFRQANANQIHQTIFTTNAKVISIGMKHKRRKKYLKSKPKTIKKMVIGCTLIIT